MLKNILLRQNSLKGSAKEIYSSVCLRHIWILIFVRASRSRSWLLHLAATEESIPDITSTDRMKYRRLLPVYIAEMNALETSDPEIWEAFFILRCVKATHGLLRGYISGFVYLNIWACGSFCAINFD